MRRLRRPHLSHLPPRRGRQRRLANALVTPELTTGITFTPTIADPQTPILTAMAGIRSARCAGCCPAAPAATPPAAARSPRSTGTSSRKSRTSTTRRSWASIPLSQWMGGRFILPGQTVDMLFCQRRRLVRGPGRLLLRNLYRSDCGHGAGDRTQGRVFPAPARRCGACCECNERCDQRTILVVRDRKPARALPCERAVRHERALLSPPCEGGVRGGGPGGTGASYAVPGRPDPAETPPRPRLMVMPCSPPLTPPFARGGKDSLVLSVHQRSVRMNL